MLEERPLKVKQILFIIITEHRNMRIGHRRTQSSTYANEPREETQPFQNHSHAHRRSEVCRLLDQSQAKIKEKVYSVDTLCTEPKETKNALFNFGKGLLSHEGHKQKQRNIEPLVAIPQKPKQGSAKCKRTPQTEVQSMKKSKQRRKSVIKISFKGQGKVPSPQEVSRIMQIKIGYGSQKTKKYAPYLAERPTLKYAHWKKDGQEAK